ncbi:MAG: hypothetical protein D6675_03010 [Gemmatimonadetes bacterium]|nr:MAG: hypothetical protein D6675_03010 [Gemmatimonadota bacterium]
MPFIKIDDHEIEVDAGRRVLDIATELGIKIPHYCYHQALSSPANCRMCLVEQVGAPKLMPSCATRVFPAPPNRKTTIDGKEYDAVFYTASPVVKEAQESIMEFLLINHPLDCPWCDQAGECRLQDYSYEYGKGHSRYKEEKRTFPKKKLGPNVLLYTNRCIMCTRCIRFCEEITGTDELMVSERGGKAQIDIYSEDKPLDNPLATCVTDICPVGALVSQDFLYKPRVWNYTRKESVCGMCASNCNISVDTKQNLIYRIKPRENQQVNSFWMCDNGRLGYNRWQNDVDRLETPMVRRNGHLEPVSWEEAYDAIKNGLKSFRNTEIAGIASPYSTNEENYLFQKLMANAFKSDQISYATGATWEAWEAKKSPFKISEFKSPNYFGAKDVIGNRHKGEIIEKISKIQVKALYWVGGNLDQRLTDGERDALQKLQFLVVQDVWLSPITEYANVVLPATNYYEKEGTFTNASHILQWVHPVVNLMDDMKPEWLIFIELAKRLGGSLGYTDIKNVTRDMLANTPAYKHIKPADIGSQGIQTRR